MSDFNHIDARVQKLDAQGLHWKVIAKRIGRPGDWERVSDALCRSEDAEQAVKGERIRRWFTSRLIDGDERDFI